MDTIHSPLSLGSRRLSRRIAVNCDIARITHYPATLTLRYYYLHLATLSSLALEGVRETLVINLGIKIPLHYLISLSTTVFTSHSTFFLKAFPGICSKHISKFKNLILLPLQIAKKVLSVMPHQCEEYSSLRSKNGHSF